MSAITCDSSDSLHLGELVILADDLPDLHRSLGVQVDKFKTGIEMVGEAQPRIHTHANFFCWLMDGEAVNLAVFIVAAVRLHHKTAARQLAEHAGVAPLGVQ